MAGLKTLITRLYTCISCVRLKVIPIYRQKNHQTVAFLTSTTQQQQGTNIRMGTPIIINYPFPVNYCSPKNTYTYAMQLSIAPVSMQYSIVGSIAVHFFQKVYGTAT